MPALDDDRLFPARPVCARARPRAVRRGARPADRQPARPHRSALVRRGRAVRRPARLLRGARPLRLPDALQPGRAPRGPRRARARRRPGRDRPARDLAALRRALPPVPRHAVAASGSTTSSPRSSASRRALAATADHVLRPDRGLPRAGRSSGRARCYDRFGIEVLATTEAPLDDARWHHGDRAVGLEGPGGHRPTAPTRWSIPSTRASAPTSSGSASSPAATPRAGRATSRRTAGAARSSATPGATATDHGHPTRADRGPAPADAAALFARCSRARPRRDEAERSAPRC